MVQEVLGSPDTRPALDRSASVARRTIDLCRVRRPVAPKTTVVPLPATFVRRSLPTWTFSVADVFAVANSGPKELSILRYERSWLWASCAQS